MIVQISSYEFHSHVGMSVSDMMLQVSFLDEPFIAVWTTAVRMLQLHVLQTIGLGLVDVITECARILGVAGKVFRYLKRMEKEIELTLDATECDPPEDPVPHTKHCK
jgi:hypothetical protein